jgi:hypothetical protein
MIFNKRKKTYGLYKNYSIINKFSKEEKINNIVLNYINNLSLEDLIAIKLELSTRMLNGKYFGIPILRSIKYISHEAVIKAAVSICRSKVEAATFLGLDYTDFRKLVKKYNVESFFEKERKQKE